MAIFSAITDKECIKERYSQHRTALVQLYTDISATTELMLY